MVRRIAHIVLVGLLAAAWSTGALAQWKWRDAGGEMHISDRPPPSDVPDKSIVQRPNQPKHVDIVPAGEASAASVAPPTAHASGVDPELEARMKHAEQERLAKQKAVDEKNATIKADNCKRAQAELRTIDSGMRLSSVNDKGERVILDDTQRASERQRAQEMVTANCR